ncbi:hypothetical protein EPO04_04160 [Patescibacteria group bacterium]|nr:MAG: hypothetical protein EPO04_04160 [Patescibacteria group bacterium]
MFREEQPRQVMLALAAQHDKGSQGWVSSSILSQEVGIPPGELQIILWVMWRKGKLEARMHPDGSCSCTDRQYRISSAEVDRVIRGIELSEAHRVAKPDLKAAA